jgi:hypothetical protein
MAIAARQFGKTAVASPGFTTNLSTALVRMTPRNQRRLQMLAPELARSGQSGPVVARLATGQADELIETLWKHKGKLATAGVVGSLLVHGDTVIAATAEHVAQPLITGTMEHVVAPISRGVTTVLVLGGIALIASFAVAAKKRPQLWRQARRMAKRAPRAALSRLREYRQTDESAERSGER